MNIFIIARGYPSKQEPTWGCFEKDQADALSKLGHKVTILSVDTRFRWYWRTLGVEHKMDDTLAIYNIFLLPYALLFFLPKRLKDWLYTWQLEYLFKRAVQTEGMPDILYAHYLYNTQKCIPIRNKYHIPLVGIEHWSQIGMRPIAKSIVKLATNIYESTDKLLTVSSALRENILAEIGVDSTVVPNIVGQEFYYRPKTYRTPVVRIVATGRLVKGKGFELLIRTIPTLKHPIELNIIGNGAERQRLQQLIHTLHIEDRVHLLGYKTKEEVVNILQDSDLFVLPSESETFGVAYIEALACGVPIIATDCGGPRDILTPFNGTLIPINDQNALAQAITRMIDHLQDYDRELIAQDCQKRFASTSIAQQLIAIFEEVISQNN